MLTIRPKPRSRMPAARADQRERREHQRAVRGLHSSRDCARGSALAGGPPVFVTRMSIGPRARVTASTSAGTRSSSALSCSKAVRADLRGHSSSPSRDRDAIATCAPSVASSLATARPMPFEAPSTRATASLDSEVHQVPRRRRAPPRSSRTTARTSTIAMASPSQCRPTATAAMLGRPARTAPSSVRRVASASTRAVTSEQATRRAARRSNPNA